MLYIYQGQEIGMTNLPTSWSHEDDIAINYYRDAVTRSGGDEKVLKKTLLHINKEGRDNARTPVQWSAESDGGFSTEPKRTPCTMGGQNVHLSALIANHLCNVRQEMQVPPMKLLVRQYIVMR